MQNFVFKCPICGNTTENMTQVRAKRVAIGVEQTLEVRCYGCENLFHFNRLIYYSEFYNIRFIPDKEE